MNTNLQLFLSNDLREAKFKDLADMYNKFATELDLKNIKKFKDKATGLKRIEEIQEKYLDKVGEITEQVEEVVEQVFDKAEKEITYIISNAKPKSETSAMGIIYKFVDEKGSVDLDELCEHFIEEYSLQYKGKAEVNTSFAKGYIKGAVRASNIKAV